MTPVLAECPFCGEDDAQMLEDPFTFLLTVRCKHCGIEVGWFISQRVAETMWNHRACSHGQSVDNESRVA